MITISLLTSADTRKIEAKKDKGEGMVVDPSDSDSMLEFTRFLLGLDASWKVERDICDREPLLEFNGMHFTKDFKSRITIFSTVFPDKRYVASVENFSRTPLNFDIAVAVADVPLRYREVQDSMLLGFVAPPIMRRDFPQPNGGITLVGGKDLVNLLAERLQYFWTIIQRTTPETIDVISVDATQARRKLGEIASPDYASIPVELTPSVSRLEPNEGDPFSARYVDIHGQNFSPLTTVYLKNAEGITISPVDTLYISSTQLRCLFELYEQEPGQYDVYAAYTDTSKGVLTSGFTITSYPLVPRPPYLSEISPAAALNTGEVVLTITGNQFVPDKYGLYLEHEGNQIDAASITVVSPNTLTAVFDLTDVWPRPYNLHIYEGVKTAIHHTCPDPFVVKSLPPKVISITPNSVQNNSVSLVMIVGEGFYPDQTASLLNTVTGQVLEITNLVRQDMTHMTGKIDSRGILPGKWEVIVTNESGQIATLHNGFTIRYLPPTLTHMTPNYGMIDIDLVISEIGGTGFRQGMTIKMRKTGGTKEIEGKRVKISSATHASCVFSLQFANVGYYDLVVTNNDGQYAVLPEAVEVADYPPVATRALPAVISNNGESTVTIYGGRFQLGDTPIRAYLLSPEYEDIPASSVLVDATGNKLAVTFNVMRSAQSGDYDLMVMNPDDQTAVLEQAIKIFDYGMGISSSSSYYPHLPRQDRWEILCLSISQDIVKQEIEELGLDKRYFFSYATARKDINYTVNNQGPDGIWYSPIRKNTILIFKEDPEHPLEKDYLCDQGSASLVFRANEPDVLTRGLRIWEVLLEMQAIDPTMMATSHYNAMCSHLEYIEDSNAVDFGDSPSDFSTNPEYQKIYYDLLEKLYFFQKGGTNFPAPHIERVEPNSVVNHGTSDLVIHGFGLIPYSDIIVGISGRWLYDGINVMSVSSNRIECQVVFEGGEYTDLQADVTVKTPDGRSYTAEKILQVVDYDSGVPASIIPRPQITKIPFLNIVYIGFKLDRVRQIVESVGLHKYYQVRYYDGSEGGSYTEVTTTAAGTYPLPLVKNTVCVFLSTAFPIKSFHQYWEPGKASVSLTGSATDIRNGLDIWEVALGMQGVNPGLRLSFDNTDYQAYLTHMGRTITADVNDGGVERSVAMEPYVRDYLVMLEKLYFYAPYTQLPPTFSSVERRIYPNNNIYEVISHGTNIQQRAKTLIRDSIRGSLPGINHTVMNETQIESEFNLVGVPAGVYDLTILNPDGQRVTSSDLIKIVDVGRSLPQEIFTRPIVTKISTFSIICVGISTVQVSAMLKESGVDLHYFLNLIQGERDVHYSMEVFTGFSIPWPKSNNAIVIFSATEVEVPDDFTNGCDPAQYVREGSLKVQDPSSLINREEGVRIWKLIQNMHNIVNTQALTGDYEDLKLYLQFTRHPLYVSFCQYPEATARMVDLNIEYLKLLEILSFYDNRYIV